MSNEVAELAAAVSVEGVPEASGQLAAFGKNVDAAASKQGGAADLSRKHTESLRAMGTTAVLAGGSLVAGLGFGVHAAEGLETALAPIGTLLGANSAATADLTGHLKNLIAESPESADDIGMSAYTILSAGISGTTNVMDALRASQKLSEAGLGSMADATDLVTSAMNAFKGENLSANSAAQILFGTISLGKTTTAGLAQGFGEVAPLASAAGVSFHDLLAATAALTATGQTAATAYTAIKGALTNIIKPTSDAAATAKQLGIDFSAAHLKSVGFAAFLDEIKAKAGGNVETMAKLFGSIEGVNAVLSLTGPQADAFASNLSKIDDAGGKLGQRADEMKDKLGNSFKEMGNQVQVAIEKGFQPLIPVVETGAHAIGIMADGFAELSSPVQIGIEALIGISGAGLLLFGTLSKLEIGFNTAKGYLQDFGKEGSLAGRATSALGDNLGTVAKGVSGLAIAAVSFDQIGKSSEQTVGGMIGMTLAGAQLGSMFPGVGTAAGAAGGFLLGFAKDAFSTESASQELAGVLQELDHAIGTLQGRRAATAFLKELYGGTWNTGTFTKAGAETNYLATTLRQLAEKNPAQAAQVAAGFATITSKNGELLFTSGAVDRLSGAVEKGAGKYRDHAQAAKTSADTNAAVAGSAGTVTEALNGTQQAFQDADTAAKNFKTTIDAVLGIGLDVESANLKWRDSLDAVTKSIIDNGAQYEVNTQAGRNNREALLGSTQAALSLAEAQFRQTGSMDQANATIGLQIGFLQQSAHQMGMNDEQTLTYIENLLGIPPEARTDIHNTADIARYEATLLEGKYNDLDGRSVNTPVNMTGDAAYSAAQLAAQLQFVTSQTWNVDLFVRAGGDVAALAGIPRGYSSGGYVGGQAGAGDVVPSMLSPGEFVLSRDMLSGRAPVPDDVVAALRGSSIDQPAAAVTTTAPAAAPNLTFQFYGDVDPLSAADEFVWAYRRAGV